MKKIDDLISKTEEDLAKLIETKATLDYWNVGDIIKLKSGEPISKFEPLDYDDNKYHGYITKVGGNEVFINYLINPVNIKDIEIVSRAAIFSLMVGDVCEIMYTDKQGGRRGDIGQVVEVFHLDNQRMIKLNNSWRDVFGGHRGGIVRLLKKKPHQHADIIKAWADGGIIQERKKGDDDESSWICRKHPDFSNIHEYRIAPKLV